jgi:hypothetical protein
LANDDSAPPQGPGGWTLDTSLYAWALWVTGDVTARGTTFDVYADPIDLIDALDGPIVMAYVEANKGRFSLFADIIYSPFDGAEDVVGTFTPRPDLTVKGNGNAKLDYTFGMYQVGAFYEVARMTGSGGNSTALELGGGGRWFNQDLDVKLEVNLTADLKASRQFTRHVDRLERRLDRIENRGQRLALLGEINALRQEFLKQRVIRASSAKIFSRRVVRLERRLTRVVDRGDVIATLEAIRELRIDLLQRRIARSSKGLTIDDAVQGQFAIAHSGDMAWGDPVAAARLTHEFGDDQAISFLGDVGGFNLSDDFSWQVLLQYEKDGTLCGFDTTTSIGYRALGILFEENAPNGQRGVDVIYHGPVAELTFRW